VKNFSECAVAVWVERDLRAQETAQTGGFCARLKSGETRCALVCGWVFRVRCKAFSTALRGVWKGCFCGGCGRGV